jgi:hypothetical protein
MDIEFIQPKVEGCRVTARGLQCIITTKPETEGWINPVYTTYQYFNPSSVCV